MPPKLFGLQSVLHLDQWIFLCSPRCPHQNFLIRDSISLQRVIGSLKQLMA